MSERYLTAKRALATASATILPLAVSAPANAAHFIPRHPKHDSNGCVYEASPKRVGAHRTGALGYLACTFTPYEQEIDVAIEAKAPHGNWRILHGHHESTHHIAHGIERTLPDTYLYRLITEGDQLAVTVKYFEDGTGELVSQPVTADDVSPMAQH